MQYFSLCSKYHTSDTVSYLLIIFEGYTSLIGMICKYEFMCFSSFAAEKSLAFPSFTPSFCDHHNMPLLQGASLLSRRLQVFGWRKEWVRERETREERGSISAREAHENGFPPPVQLPESHCVIFQLILTGNDWHLHKQRVVHLYLRSKLKYICHKDQLGYLSDGPVNWC